MCAHRKEIFALLVDTLLAYLKDYMELLIFISVKNSITTSKFFQSFLIYFFKY